VYRQAFVTIPGDYLLGPTRLFKVRPDPLGPGELRPAPDDYGMVGIEDWGDPPVAPLRANADPGDRRRVRPL